MAQNNVKPFILTTVLSSAITTSYQPINPSGFIESPFYVRITNGSSNPIVISFDGSNDHEFILPMSAFDLPSQAGSQPNAHAARFSKHTIVYVRGQMASTGNITLSGYYV